jgi:hypothetical protein
MNDFLKLLESESLKLGYYYVTGLNEFDEGQIVTIYQHSYLRLLTFDKNDKLYTINITEIHRNFFTKESWRERQLGKLLQNETNKKRKRT